MQSQFLIFDADDTLWENDIYFEAAFDQFCQYLSHSSMAPGEIRAVLDEIEMVNSQIHGYGSRNFARNLTACYERLTQGDVAEQDRKAVMDLAHAILEQPIELIAGVRETVHELAGRHQLILFTKGDPEEQQLKIERSGLAPYFLHTAIVREKNEVAYRHLTLEQGLHPTQSWMIGNSPKSDIKPALEAGLNAVFVPHARTWRLENTDLPLSHPRLLRISSLPELTKYF